MAPARPACARSALPGAMAARRNCSTPAPTPSPMPRASCRLSRTACWGEFGRSAPVAAVDVDVAVRQVAGPHRGAATAEREIDLDVHLASLHVLDHRGLVVARRHAAIPRHPYPTHRHADRKSVV